MYNNLYPLKDVTTGKTEKRVLASSGNVLMFDVDRSKLGL